MGGGRGNGPKNTRGANVPNYMLSPVIHKGSQDKHIVGTNNYKNELSVGRTPSILTADPHELLKKYSGTGQLAGDKRERVDFGFVIGKYYDIGTNTYYDTTVGIIRYRENGDAHIVPAAPNNFRSK